MKIVHPVFGELIFNYGWTKSIKLNIFNTYRDTLLGSIMKPEI